jgi:membrane protein required for colicin V production
VDLAVAVILALATFSSLRAGFLRQAFTIIGFVVGIYAALTHRETVATVLSSAVGNPALASVVAFVLIFAAVWFGSAVLASMAYAGLKASGLAWADHVLGMLLGLTAGLLLTVGLLLLLSRVPLPALNDAVGQSILASLIFEALPHLQQLLPADLRILRTL